MSRMFVIVNPTAGRGATRRALPRIKDMLSKAGIDYHMAFTEKPRHASDLAARAQADGADIVVAVGGDGTINEVVNGLMRSREKDGSGSALGIISAGRGNDFAVGAGIPTDLKSSCKLLAAGQSRPMDMGLVCGDQFPEGRYFCNGIGIGFDAIVGFEVAKLFWLRGLAAYGVAALKSLFLYHRAPTVEIELAGETVTQPSLMISVMNGRTMGGGFKMAPKADMADGLFDLCIATTAGRMKILHLMGLFLKGEQEGDPIIRMTRASQIAVRAVEGTLPAHADGEVLCRHGAWLEAEIIPSALDVIGFLKT